MAYAQKRIRLLEDTLHKREELEGKLLEDALNKQQSEHEKLSAMKLNHELEKLRNDLNAIMIQKVNICRYLQRAICTRSFSPSHSYYVFYVD